MSISVVKCSWVKCGEVKRSVVKCSEVLQCSDVLLVHLYRFVYGCTFCILLFNSVSYVLLLLYLCIVIVMFMYCYCYVYVFLLTSTLCSVYSLPPGILRLP